MTTITRPTTVAQRAQFAGLTADQRITVRNAAIASGLAGKDAWTAGFASLETTKRSSGVAGKTFQRAVGHRLVDLRAHSAGCSCGKAYKGEGPAALRAAHASHKAKAAK
jgi:hypothetical protein